MLYIAIYLAIKSNLIPPGHSPFLLHLIRCNAFTSTYLRHKISLHSSYNIINSTSFTAYQISYLTQDKIFITVFTSNSYLVNQRISNTVVMVTANPVKRYAKTLAAIVMLLFRCVELLFFIKVIIKTSYDSLHKCMNKEQSRNTEH